MFCNASVIANSRSEYEATPTRKRWNCLSSLALGAADRDSTRPIALQAALNAATFRRERRVKAMNSSAGDARHGARLSPPYLCLSVATDSITVTGVSRDAC